MSTKESVPGNLQSSPMTYDVVRAPSLFHLRETLANEADGLTVEEIRSRAGAAQFDLAGATTKEKMISAIRTQARGADPTATENV